MYTVQVQYSCMRGRCAEKSIHCTVHILYCIYCTVYSPVVLVKGVMSSCAMRGYAMRVCEMRGRMEGFKIRGCNKHAGLGIRSLVFQANEKY